MKTMYTLELRIHIEMENLPGSQAADMLLVTATLAQYLGFITQEHAPVSITEDSMLVIVQTNWNHYVRHQWNKEKLVNYCLSFDVCNSVAGNKIKHYWVKTQTCNKMNFRIYFLNIELVYYIVWKPFTTTYLEYFE